MTREYFAIFLKVMLVLENLSKVDFGMSKLIFECFKIHILDLNCHFGLSHSLKLDLNVHIWRSHHIFLDLNASKNLGSWKYWISSHSKNQPSWQSLNQTSKLDSHPGCHSIKPVNCTAILAVTQSNQSVNHGGR